ncbi:MAG: PQQ-binding-like beta-propeller repeat protein, partial [Bacteroidota bacterium]
TPNGASNTIPLTVMLRQQQGRVKWAFEADVNNLWFRPALAPDGTVYVHGSEGFVFALTPDGGLKWIHKVNWYPYVPPQAGSEGEVYVGSIQRVTAINPDGTERWRFTDNATQGIHVSAKPAPDGNIYAANDFGLGAYSLTPGGQFRWSNPGNPALEWYGGSGAEMVFGPRAIGDSINQMYVAMNPLATQSMLQAFRLSDGALQFSVPIGGTDPTTQNQTQPAVGPNGTIYITHLRGGGGIGWTLEAFSPTNGQSLWRYNSWNTSSFSPPDVGPDGVVYYVASLSRLVSFDPATPTERWNRFDGTVLFHPTVSPLNNMVVTGGVVTFGDLGFIKAISTGSGQLLWTVPLPGAPYPEPRVVPVHQPRFTPNGNTVYVSTTILGGSATDPHSFLYAIATDSTTDVIESSDISSFRLLENYPNPFNPSTTIRYDLAKTGNVSLKVFDVLGREVTTLVNEEKLPGSYSVRWDATNVGSGTYFYRLESNGRREIKKMLLMK